MSTGRDGGVARGRASLRMRGTQTSPHARGDCLQVWMISDGWLN